MRYSFTAHFRPSLFQEAVGEGWAINRIGASHGDCPLPGRVTVSLPGTELYRIMASPGTLTLFLKLTTKWSISEIMSGLGCILRLGGKVASEQSLARCNPLEQVGKFIARELPRKGLRMLVAQVLVKCESHANGIQVGKVVWREHLALDDRKVDLDLVEPTGMNRSMDQDDARINFPQAVAGRFATM